MWLPLRPPVTVLTSAAILLLISCSDPGYSDSNWDGFVRDSAGVEIVMNNGKPLWDETDPWVLSEVLRIGVSEGEPEYMFGRLGSMGVLSDGRIVVADVMAQHLRFFLRDGRWEKTVGQPGSGPGEFGSRGMTILVGPGDTLVVLDEQAQRANQIAPDGMWLGSWRTAPDDGWMVRAWDYSRTGRIVSHMSRYPLMETSESDTLDYVLQRDLGGSIVDTVGTVPASRLRQVSGGRMEFYLYAGQPAASLCPDNTLVTGHGDRYEIKRYDPSGDLEQVVKLGRPNVPITGNDQEFLRRRFRELYLENGFTPVQVEALLSGMHFTETYPAFAFLWCGPGGSIWVQPVRPISSLSSEERATFWVGPDAEADPLFDVFDRQGRYLGVVPLPDGFWPRRFHGDNLLGRWQDSLDVEYIKVLKVEGFPPVSDG